MFLVTNKSERVYIIGDKNIVPGAAPVELTDEEAKHPIVQAHVKARNLELTEVTEPLGTKSPEQMTVNELRAYAKANQIELGEATKKEDILTAIKAAELVGE